MDKPFLSVVSPCYNEEETVPEFYWRVTEVCERLGLPYELVLVNDGSRDATWDRMVELTRTDPHVVAINLSRNHGQQLALSAGLSHCRGERILILDADLQDPPELLPEMLERIDRGADVVFGQRRQRAGETVLKRATSALFYRLISKISSVPIPLDTGDFRLITRRVLDHLLAMPEQHRFIRGMVSWLGFRQEALLYDRDARFAGETKYPFRKLCKLATDAITSFSTQPLLYAGYVGAFLLLAGMGLLGGGLVGLCFGAHLDSLLVLLGAMSFLGGLQLVGMGLLGAYLGRLCEQSKGRPLFLIERIERHVIRPRGQPVPRSIPALERVAEEVASQIA
jgi:dolichol-phosphate mannosyltransferase